VQSVSSHSSACNVTNIEHIDILQYLSITVRSCDPEINGNIDDENSFLMTVGTAYREDGSEHNRF
jgi:hypothetical protein